MFKIENNNKNAKQFQLEYAVYMMLGSYFKKATCKSKIIEKKLFLYYQELGSSKQEDLEEEVIKFIDDILLNALDIPGIAGKAVNILFIPVEKGHIISIKGKNVAINLRVCRKSGKLKYAFIKNVGQDESGESVKWIPQDEKNNTRRWKGKKKQGRAA